MPPVLRKDGGNGGAFREESADHLEKDLGGDRFLQEGLAFA